MIVKKMLLPTIKKKIVLFLAMLAVMILSVILSCGFANSYISFKRNANDYINNYGYPDITFVTNEFNYNDISTLSSVDGVEIAKPRINLKVGTLRGFSPKINKLITIPDNSFVKFYDKSTGNHSNDLPNIYYDFIYAQNNNVSVNSTATIYKDLNTSFKVNVEKIVGTPETIFPMIEYGFQADKYNFGYAFIKESEFRTISGYENQKYNEIIIKIKEGYSEEIVARNATNALKDKVTINTTVLKSSSLCITNLQSNVQYLFILSVSIPLVFTSITVILIVLFLYQITKQMTKEIGTLNALGVNFKQIYLLLLSFTLSIALIGGLIGVAFAPIFSNMVYSLTMSSFSMPIPGSIFSLPIMFITLGVTLIIAFLSSSLTIFSLRKITPKEAMIDNMDKNKPLPKWVEKITNKSNSLKLATNSIHKNKIRAFISCFAIAASFMTTYAAISFNVSLNNYIDEFSYRLNYKAEVYSFDQTKVDDLKKTLEQDSNITGVENYFYNTFTFTFNDKEITSTIVGIENSSQMINIPGDIKVVSDGIVIEKVYADEVGLKVNDIINVKKDDKTIIPIKVSAISSIGGLKYNYCCIDTFKSLYGINGGYHSLLVNFKSRNDFSKVILSYDALPLFTSELIKTYVSTFQLVIGASQAVMIVTLIISFIVLCIMSQSSLQEQKRKLCTLKALGVREKKISKILFLETFIYIILGMLPALPLGVLLNYIIVQMSNTKRITIIMFNKWYVFLLAIGAVILTITVNFLINMIIRKKWNIANNIRSRE